jgi:intracellular septation protein
MKLFFDLFPLLLFFGAFKLYGIYVATLVAIVASLVQVAIFRLRQKRFETMHLVTLAVISVFGGLTIVLHDDTFIKWKPTIVNWVFSALLLGSQVIGRRTAMEVVLGSQLQLPKKVWLTLNMSWGLFFLLLGALNLYVAFLYGAHLDEQTRLEHWVDFKVFGMMGLTLLFVIIQSVFLAKYMDPAKESETP